MKYGTPFSYHHAPDLRINHCYLDLSQRVKVIILCHCGFNSEFFQNRVVASAIILCQVSPIHGDSNGWPAENKLTCGWLPCITVASAAAAFFQRIIIIGLRDTQWISNDSMLRGNPVCWCIYPRERSVRDRLATFHRSSWLFIRDRNRRNYRSVNRPPIPDESVTIIENESRVEIYDDIGRSCQ